MDGKSGDMPGASPQSNPTEGFGAQGWSGHQAGSLEMPRSHLEKEHHSPSTLAQAVCALRVLGEPVSSL